MSRKLYCSVPETVLAMAGLVGDKAISGKGLEESWHLCLSGFIIRSSGKDSKRRERALTPMQKLHEGHA